MFKELSLIEGCIKTFVEKFLQMPYIFWSESDAKCYLYHFLILTPALQNRYKTLDGKVTNLIHTEYKSRSGGRFDIAIINPKTIEQRPFNNQNLLCGIELGLDCGSDHFALDFARKLRKEAENPIDFGYIIHFMRNRLDIWDDTVQDIINNLMPPNSEFLVQPTKTGECGVLVVKVRVKEQEA